jgi:hypothetical protein
MADQQRSVDVAEKCSALSLQDCVSDPECATLAAMAVDTDHQCLQPEAPVVCTKKNLGCDTALAIVEVAGKRYRMNGICDTPGVVVVDATFSQGTPEFMQVAWTKCATQQSLECAAGTALHTPGCGRNSTWDKGCYASCRAVGDDAGCTAGYTCQETSINPCVPKPGETSSCDACGMQTHLCLAKHAGT